MCARRARQRRPAANAKPATVISTQTITPAPPHHPAGRARVASERAARPSVRRARWTGRSVMGREARETIVRPGPQGLDAGVAEQTTFDGEHLPPVRDRVFRPRGRWTYL